MYSSIIAAALTLMPTMSNAQEFSLIKDYSGQNFFPGFKYNASAVDYNNFGNVHFLSQADAVSRNLTYVDSNNHIIIKVDNTTTDPNAGKPFDNFGRDTVYLMSMDLIQIGSLLILDANHIPFGCSVWPGFFTQGQVWPAQGEIDIIENVNLATANQYALHVGYSPCNQPQSVTQTGKITSNGLNCTTVPSLNINPEGCAVVESQQNSFGQGFAQNGGGVYSMLWAEEGISMWFFPRNNIPSDVSATADNPNPTNWGTPGAFYPASGCSPTAAFGDQIITFYIDICGAFAGQNQTFSQTCASVAPDCISLVGNPANYNDAYWDINYLRVFASNSNSSNSSSSSGGSGSNSTGSGSGSNAHSVVASVPTAILGFALALGLVAVALV